MGKADRGEERQCSENRGLENVDWTIEVQPQIRAFHFRAIRHCDGAFAHLLTYDQADKGRLAAALACAQLELARIRAVLAKLDGG